MSVNFFGTECTEPSRTDEVFGICDQIVFNFVLLNHASVCILFQRGGQGNAAKGPHLSRAFPLFNEP